MKHIVASIAALVLTSTIGFIACSTETPINGQCESTVDCNNTANTQPDGSVCDPSGVCVCPSGTRACCPKNATISGCKQACLPQDQCREGVDAGQDAPDTPECVADNDCPQPPSPECGTGSCVNGVCNLQIKVGPLDSQLYGDCKRRDCDTGGTLAVIDDSSDFYNDGIECTFDSCKNGQPINQVLSDGTVCPDSGQGYCFQSSCVECIGNMPATACPGAFNCDSVWCVPFPQCSGMCGGLCAPCAAGYPCANDIDCLSSHCVAGQCVLPTCADGHKNGGETGTDCGGGGCGLCPSGQGCHVAADCESGVCKAGLCQAPTCVDAVKNDKETGVDCGGSCKVCP